MTVEDSVCAGSPVCVVVGGGTVSVVLVGGGVVASTVVAGVVRVVDSSVVAGDSVGAAGVLCAWALGSSVESVVTSVTGGTGGLATVGCGALVVALGVVGATAASVLAALFGTAILAFFVRRRLVRLDRSAATTLPVESVTG